MPTIPIEPVPPSHDTPTANGRQADGILEIDLNVLAANWRFLNQKMQAGEKLRDTGRCVAAAVVKADAYGLGLVPVARRLAAEGCTAFFVAQLSEAIHLRSALPDHPIYVLNGLMNADEAYFEEHGLTPVLNDYGQIERWADWCRSHEPAPAAIQFDTGMSRLGLPPDETVRFLDDSSMLEQFIDPLLMSHLACADEPDHLLNIAQRDNFLAITARLPDLRASFANSSGLFLGDDYLFELGRPGVALYGSNPTPGLENPMQPVVTLRARILQVRQIDTGHSVGYGATHRADKPLKIATLAAGYADGYLRSLSNRGHVIMEGHKAPIVGRVSMDLLTVDVTGLPENVYSPGKMAELINADWTVDDVAADAGTIGYEILTGLGNRYARRYVGETG